mmetsp:Transcript_49102/g.56556  ORF Transcript_49102/g.56556 Transcript_49102/m.56556 type:complete len:215 (+) Transcript_49102:33-677(+)
MISQLNHYEALGVAQTASQSEIRSAYKTLVLKFHPDKNEDKETATVIFNRIQEAYEVLNNQEARNRYDVSLYIKSMNDDKFSVSEESTSTIFDINESIFETFGSASTLDSLKDILEENDSNNSFSFARSKSEFEEYQCFREFMVKMLFEQDSMNFFDEIEKTQAIFKGIFSYNTSGEGYTQSKMPYYGAAPKMNSRSHKISKQERPKVQINKKN